MGTRARRRRTTIPYKVREIARKYNVSIQDAIKQYNEVLRSKEEDTNDLQAFALDVSSSINQWKLNH